MGILEYIMDAAQRGASMIAPTQADVDMRPKVAKGLLEMLPGSGDALSGYEAYQSAKEGDWIGMGLNGAGLLPFVPSLGYTVHKIGDIKILEEPTREMVKNLAAKSRYGEVRGLVDPDTNKQYWWDAGLLNHNDVADWFKMNWDAILSNSDKSRKIMKESAIDGTPWKFSGE